MSEIPATRPSLLQRLSQSQQDGSWSEFAELYTPLIYGFLRRRGLQDADAADITQEVFRAVARSIGGFEHPGNRGSFRSWLLTITQNKLIDHVHRQKPWVAGEGGTRNLQALAEQPITSEEADRIERDYQKRLFEKACRLVQKEFRDTTWQAFWKTQIEMTPATKVASQLEMTVEAVYVARSRVIAKLRERIHQLDE